MTSPLTQESIQFSEVRCSATLPRDDAVEPLALRNCQGVVSWIPRMPPARLEAFTCWVSMGTSIWPIGEVEDSLRHIGDVLWNASAEKRGSQVIREVVAVVSKEVVGLHAAL